MDTTDRTILKRFILGVVAILLVGVIIWVFFFRDDTKKNTSSNTKTDSSEQSGSKNAASDTKQPASSGSGVQGESTDSNSQNSNTQQPDTLANAGPGNVVVLFAGTAAIGTLGHHLYSRKRRSRAA